MAGEHEDAAQSGDDRGAIRRALSRYRPRNDRLVDVWSFVHLGVTAVLALAFGPVLAFLVALAWEPLEVLVLSPLLARVGVDFGHEDLKNSVSDLAFNLAGAILGFALATLLGWSAPFGWP